MVDTYKVVLLGDMAVGKTCIIAQFTSGQFDPDTVTSSSANFRSKSIEFLDGKSIKFNIWDTMGQEKYRSMAQIFYKDARIVILVYDISNQKSFEGMKDYWYPQVKEKGPKEIILAVVANKSDLYELRQVEDEEGETFAKSIGAIFASTSARNDTGITSLFENIGRMALDPNFDFWKKDKVTKSPSFMMNTKTIKEGKKKQEESSCC